MADALGASLRRVRMEGSGRLENERDEMQKGEPMTTVGRDEGNFLRRNPIIKLTRAPGRKDQDGQNTDSRDSKTPRGTAPFGKAQPQDRPPPKREPQQQRQRLQQPTDPTRRGETRGRGYLHILPSGEVSFELRSSCTDRAGAPGSRWHRCPEGIAKPPWRPQPQRLRGLHGESPRIRPR